MSPELFVYAGLIRRLFAHWLDNILLWVLTLVLLTLLSALMAEELAIFVSMMSSAILVNSVIPALNEGRGLGHKALGIYIIDENGQAISPVAAFLRGIAKLFTAGLFPIAILGWAFGRGPLPDLGGMKALGGPSPTGVRLLHDRIAGSYAVVVRTPA